MSLVKNVVVVGGSRGIGFAIAEKFCRHSYCVTILSRNKTNVMQSVNKLIAQNSDKNVFGEVCDVSSEESVNNIFKVICNRHKTIDILVNAAGINADNILMKVSKKQIMQTIDTNLIGPMLTSKAVLRTMIRQRKGTIINIGL